MNVILETPEETTARIITKINDKLSDKEKKQEKIIVTYPDHIKKYPRSLA